MTIAIDLPDRTFYRLEQHAKRLNQSIDETLETLLHHRADEKYQCIDVVMKPTGRTALVDGTRYTVANIIGYLRLGMTPKEIIHEISPAMEFMLAHIYSAVAYYHAHRAEIDEQLDYPLDPTCWERVAEEHGVPALLKQVDVVY